MTAPPVRLGRRPWRLGRRRGPTAAVLELELAPAMLAALDRADHLLGRSVPVVSGYRSRAEQEALWNRRSPIPQAVAPPGTSLHEVGLAIDVPHRGGADAPAGGGDGRSVPTPAPDRSRTLRTVPPDPAVTGAPRASTTRRTRRSTPPPRRRTGRSTPPPRRRRARSPTRPLGPEAGAAAADPRGGTHRRAARPSLPATDIDRARPVAGPRLVTAEEVRTGVSESGPRLRARKVKRIVRRFDAWSVLKVSFIFYLCVYAVSMVSAVILWNVAAGAGVIDNIESFIEDLGAFETFEFVPDKLLKGTPARRSVLTVLATGSRPLGRCCSTSSATSSAASG